MTGPAPARDVLTTLRREFDADDDTFLLKLRGSQLEWDKDAFSRLEQAMRATCELFQGRDRLDRWIAEGFYEVSHFVRGWTSHPHFPRPKPDEYYDACLERLDDLADWFFRGVHNYIEPHTWPDL
ncbi:hypothetical protein GCM10023194_62900 [Planotetraspora phitsanulokensis]|uniref:Uncharacterized protein n=1 Tax=Planotetraspora phitsanulokensis TaxID=575192 RepID=A0A8J3XE94_9ACTN|nr:hypothetical protein [Planotetraspora phitsanulokensis]GII37489.1 hypothetical protein Pph01_24920 [Planotetraspora phitsanulokensis]